MAEKLATAPATHRAPRLCRSCERPPWKLARSILSSSCPALQCPPTHRGKSGRSTSLPSSPARPSAAVPCGRTTDQPLKCAACTSCSPTVAPALRALYWRIYSEPPRPFTTLSCVSKPATASCLRRPCTSRLAFNALRHSASTRTTPRVFAMRSVLCRSTSPDPPVEWTHRSDPYGPPCNICQ